MAPHDVPRTAPYRSRIDVRITPEPTEDERRLIVAALARPAVDDGGGAAGSHWRSAALRENIEGDPRYESEPGV